MQVYKDTGKADILTQAQTIQRASQCLLLWFAKSIPDVKIALFAISQANAQPKIPLVRNIHLKLIPELELPDSSLLRMVRPFYGIPLAGTVKNQDFFERKFTCLVQAREVCNDRNVFSLENEGCIINFSSDYFSRC